MAADTTFNRACTPFNTQTNEALNQSQVTLTPKAKVFHESMAFNYRNGICIGVHNWGFKRYWQAVVGFVGIVYLEAFQLFLERKEKNKKEE